MTEDERPPLLHVAKVRLETQNTDRDGPTRWHTVLQTRYLVPVVCQVYPERSHAVENELHGGQEVIQHRGL